MTVLVIEHHEEPSLAVIGETLENLGISTQTVWTARGDSIPEGPENYRGMVLLGGAMDVMDDDNHPYYRALMRLIGQFHDADKPQLGICHGAQMIARTFNARIKLAGPLEFGFVEVRPTTEGRSDPVVGHMEEPHNLFEWHTDHYDLPTGAVQLATGKTYSNQCYRIGRATYGTQFHLEVNQSLVESWISHYPEMAARAPGYEEWLPEQFDAFLKKSMEFCTEMTRRWVDLAN